MVWAPTISMEYLSCVRAIQMVLFFYLAPFTVVGQVFSVELLDGTEAQTQAHPTEAFIFHMNSFNTSVETILIDIVKSNQMTPASWDISICTNACLPPEIDEATYFIPEEGSTEVSIYFFADSPGEGGIDVSLTSQEDSTETFEYTFSLIAEGTVGLDDVETSSSDESWVEWTIDKGTWTIAAPRGTQVNVYSASGQWLQQIQLQNSVENLDFRDLESGMYIIDFQNDRQRMSTKWAWWGQ